MATEILLTRQGTNLCPADSLSNEAVKALKHGEMVRATIVRPRNAKHHRMAWALFTILFEHQDRYPTVEHLVDALKIATGHYDSYETKDGQTVVKPRSISYSAMDQTAFSQWWDAVMHVVMTRILPGTTREDLEREVYEFLGIGGRAA